MLMPRPSSKLLHQIHQLNMGVQQEQLLIFKPKVEQTIFAETFSGFIETIISVQKHGQKIIMIFQKVSSKGIRLVQAWVDQ